MVISLNDGPFGVLIIRRPLLCRVPKTGGGGGGNLERGPYVCLYIYIYMCVYFYVNYTLPDQKTSAPEKPLADCGIPGSRLVGKDRA